MANHITILFVEEAFDEIGAGVMDKSLASRFDKAIKHRAKFCFNKFGNIFSMKFDVVLHDSTDDCAEGTLVIEAIVLFSHKISVSAFLLKTIESGVYLLIYFYPIVHMKHVDQLKEHESAIGVVGGWGYIWLRDAQFLIENACMIEHFHEFGVNSAGVSCFEKFFDLADVLIEMFENMHVWGKGGKE